MIDTTPEAQKILHERYMQMTGEQRMLIGMQMFESAREIVISSLPKNISEQEKRYLLCKRFYGDLADKAFPKMKKNKI